MFSRLFGRKKQEKDPYQDLPMPETADWSVFGADMHSHFIPGIDDGAKTMEDSLALIKGMADMGYKTIVTTPHIMIDYYANTAEIINSGLKTVQDALKENNIDVTLRAAAEYYIDDHFEQLLEQGPLLTIHKKEVLVEISMLFEPPGLANVLFNMQRKGYRPVIAHPERYLFFHRDISKYQELKDRGCMLQLNMLAITGYYGQNIKAVAEQLLARGLYDYIGTDMHHDKHAGLVNAIARSKDYHRLAAYPFKNRAICE
ncbi:MAG: CpsB/CapC family capsule biosynthesis tyrosine phosphatase [Bacteroidota bacterium]